MPQEVYNEGRVVGYSAYEIYVKHFLSDNPEGTPASESEWLASSLSSGSSLLINVPAEPETAPAGLHVIDIDLPHGSSLRAGNTIIGNLFMGLVDPDAETGICDVVDYGPLLFNDDTHDPADKIASPEAYSYDTSWKTRLQEYLKIVDGIMIQDGTWEKIQSGSERSDLKPDLSEAPTVRLAVSNRIEHPFAILLTGFTDSGVLSGEVSLDGSMNTPNPQNGDFLGPQCFPWAAKIMFAMPTAAQSLDIVTPGTVRMFQFDSTSGSAGLQSAKAFEDKGGKALLIDQFRRAYTLDSSQPSGLESIPIAKVGTNMRTVGDDVVYYESVILAGNEKRYAISTRNERGESLIPDYDGEEVDVIDPQNESGYLTWWDMLHALANKSHLDFLGPVLRTVKTSGSVVAGTLPTVTLNLNLTISGDISGTNITGTTVTAENISGTAISGTTVTATDVDGTNVSGTAVTAGNKYITLGSTGTGTTPLRLYISSDEPTDDNIPDGSIGIGW